VSRVNYSEFEGARPYFELVRGALGGLVDGDHFFDVVAENVVYEVRYELGWPRMIEGREDLMKDLRSYCRGVKLEAAGNLTTHKMDGGSGVVIEYEVRGTILGNGARYENRFCSVIGIEGRNIVRWRDYMDSLAAWKALTAK
jgi:uncharacterized protein